MQNVVRVGFDAMKKVIISRVEKVGDGRLIACAVPESFGTTQK